jgi:putative ABC transport system permease protein
MKKFALSSLWARKRRVIGASIAVIIGVAFLASTMILGDAMTKGIDNLFTEGYSGTDVHVRSATEISNGEMDARNTIDASLLDELQRLPEVAGAQPKVEGLATMVGNDGDPIGGNGPPTFGLNWVEFDRNPYVLTSGRAPRARGEVVIDSGTANTGGLAVGDATTVQVRTAEPVTIVGIAELASGNQLGGVTFTWFDTTTAQSLLLAGDDVLSGVDLQAAPGVSDAELQSAVQGTLPSDLEALTEQQLIDENTAALDADFLGFFKTFLLAFAVIALLVATFSISNTFAILVAQRTRESALLRAIGASRRQVLASVTAEALVIGALATAIGLGVGVGVAFGLNALLTAAGFGIPTAGMGLSVSTAVICGTVGLAVTLLASIVPAIRASRVAPLAALRDIAVDRSGFSKVRAGSGALVVGAGITGMALATEVGDSPMQIAGWSSLAMFVGFVLLGPVVARVASSVIGAPVAALRGQSGVLARRNAMRNPKRTSGTASALMIGTAVVALFASFGSSLTQSLDDLVAESFGGDLVITPQGFSSAAMSPQMAADIDALPDVEAVARLSFAAMLVDGRNDDPLATDFSRLLDVASLGGIEGDLSAAGDDALVIGRGYAEEHSLAVGDTVSGEFIDGSSEPLTVRAIFENENLLGDLLVSSAAWERHTNTPEDFVVMIGLADGADLGAVRPQIEDIAASYGSPNVEDSDEYLESQGAQIDQMLGLVYGLLGLAVVIALVGIANTLSLSIHERTREIGLLRAVGQSCRGVRSTVRWESVIIAVFGTVGGLVLGTFMCWGLFRAIAATEGFGTFAPSMTTLGVVLAVAIVAGVLAAARPARRAANLDVLEAISTE